MKNLLSNFPIKMKVIGNSLILLILLIGIAIFSLQSMTQIGYELEAIADQDIPLTEKITAITEHQLEQAIHFERALRYAVLMPTQKTAGEHLQLEIEAFNRLSKKVDKEIHEGELMLEADIADAHSEHDRKEFEHIDQVLRTIGKEHGDFDHHANTVFDHLLEGQFDQAAVLFDQVEQEEDQLDEELEALLLEVGKFTEEASKRAEQHEHEAIQVLAALVIAAVIFGGLVSWSVAQNIIKRLRASANSLAIIAQGDLTQNIQVEGKDEISGLQQSMSTMQNRLLEMIANIGDSTHQLASASEEVASIMSQTTNNIRLQQVETNEISKAMNEMKYAVAEVSTGVENTSNAADGANAEATNGQAIVQDAIDGISQLASQIDNTSVVITEVEQSSEEINTVLDVIKGIAEQTNLLALNAAIEAARAGEQGRGFAVVADEVRTLASRTQESTIEINQIIEKLQSGASKAGAAMNLSRDQSQIVVEKATATGTSLSSIGISVGRINDMSTKIAASAEEQNVVAQNMISNIDKINTMAVENTTSVEQVSIAGNDLARISAGLQGMVEQFKVS